MPHLLRNRTKTPRVYNLPHRLCCGDGCRCSAQEMRRAEQAPDGTVGIRVWTKMIPGSLRLPGGAGAQVPDCYLTVPEIQADVRAGVLRVTPVPAPGPVPTKKRDKRGKK